MEQYFQTQSRRQFLQGSGIGLGAFALSSLLAESASARPSRASVSKSASRSANPLCASGSARDLPAHDRRSFAARFVRSQAETGRARRPDLPIGAVERKTICVHRRRNDAGRISSIGFRNMAKAVSRFPSCCRICRRLQTISRYSRDFTRMRSITPRRRCFCIPGSGAAAGRASVRGPYMGWGQRIRICPRSS